MVEHKNGPTIILNCRSRYCIISPDTICKNNIGYTNISSSAHFLRRQTFEVIFVMKGYIVENIIFYFFFGSRILQNIFDIARPCMTKIASLSCLGSVEATKNKSENQNIRRVAWRAKRMSRKKKMRPTIGGVCYDKYSYLVSRHVSRNNLRKLLIFSFVCQNDECWSIFYRVVNKQRDAPGQRHLFPFINCVVGEFASRYVTPMLGHIQR